MRLTLIAAMFISATMSARAGYQISPSCAEIDGEYHRAAMVVEKTNDCCVRRLQCPKFLSTTTVVRPAHDQRT